MGQKHKSILEIWTPFPSRDIRKNPRRMCACGSQSDGAICAKNRKIVPYHRDSPKTRNGARLRFPSPIMAAGGNQISNFLIDSEGSKSSREINQGESI